MRIKCPYCGERDAEEFGNLGAGGLARPDPNGPGAQDAFYEYVYLRDNPAGPMSELWYHRAGCRRWLVVQRDTRSHAISSAAFAGAAPDAAPDEAT
jgi:methylglutamate dehydrogenase subunit B